MTDLTTEEGIARATAIVRGWRQEVQHRVAFSKWPGGYRLDVAGLNSSVYGQVWHG